MPTSLSCRLVFACSNLSSPEAFSDEIASITETVTDLFSNLDVTVTIHQDGTVWQNNGIQRVRQGSLDVDFYVVVPLTGGTERALAPIALLRVPSLFLAKGCRNSMAAALELRHYFSERLSPSTLLPIDVTADWGAKAQEFVNKVARDIAIIRSFRALKFCIIGRISPWLVNERPELLAHTRISSRTLVERTATVTPEESAEALSQYGITEHTGRLLAAAGVYLAMRDLCREQGINCLTLGCFAMIDDLKTTPCLALAMLNAPGPGMVTSACEGDLNAMIVMGIASHLLSLAPFMSNISAASDEQRTITVAHCTAPVAAGAGEHELGTSFETPTHFETGLGVAVTLALKSERALLLRAAGRRLTVLPVDLVEQEHRDDCCRTQARLSLAGLQTLPSVYLQKYAAGNHHILVRGDLSAVCRVFECVGFEVTVIE